MLTNHVPIKLLRGHLIVAEEHGIPSIYGLIRTDPVSAGGKDNFFSFWHPGLKWYSIYANILLAKMLKAWTKEAKGHILFWK